MQLARLLDGRCDLVALLTNVIRPCAYNVYGIAPEATVEIHQNRAEMSAGGLGWAIAAWRGKHSDNNRFCGSWIDDIVIVSRDLKKIIGTVFGVYQFPFLGNPARISCPDAKPVRVFQTPIEWLKKYGDGVVLLGNEREQVAWLRECEAGIVTDNVTHGEKIQKMIRREILGPKILVAAS